MKQMGKKLIIDGGDYDILEKLLISLKLHSYRRCKRL